ncbi:MAG: glycine cleavage system aminomethyltransferase GcvT [Phycisphaerales bacterium]|nr:glycine cleavage system aminomethyltransferase GcvT [Phycisphaerales bacterium]
MLKTPLHQFHLDYNAHMVEFAGWNMPLYYSSVTAEHAKVRSSGGIFDVSHMARLKVTGRHARRLLERACSRRISDMVQGQCRYSLICNERGGVLDDVIVYRFDDDDFLVVVNASNREKIVRHLQAVKAAGEFNCSIDDQTASTAMVALQGPSVIPLVSRFSSEIPTLKKYRFTVKNLLIVKITVSRTGYTGEDGIEVILPAGAISMAMKLLFQDINLKDENAPIRPAGLGARDTLRMEAGMPLYGHELGEEICALSCGVDFALSLDKDQGDRGETFIGMDALKKVAAEGGPTRKLAGFFVEGKRSARQGMVIKQNGKDVGVVTSGCPSPTLNKCIAMGFLDAGLHAQGTKVEIDTGKGVLEAVTTPLPFYKAPKAG